MNIKWSILIIISILVISGCLNTTNNSKRHNSIDISIVPSMNSSYYVYLPVISFNDAEIINYESIISGSKNVSVSFISTIYGDAINVSSNEFVRIFTKDPIEEPKGSFKISLENSEDASLYERLTSFNIFLNSNGNNTVSLDFSVERTSTSNSDYYSKIEIDGILSNGWNIIEGSISVDQN